MTRYKKCSTDIKNSTTGHVARNVYTYMCGWLDTCVRVSLCVCACHVKPQKEFAMMYNVTKTSGFVLTNPLYISGY